MGHTHIRLAGTNKDVLTGALRTAWRLRIEVNAKDMPDEAPVAGPWRSSKQEKRKVMTLTYAVRTIIFGKTKQSRWGSWLSWRKGVTQKPADLGGMSLHRPSAEPAFRMVRSM
jgi:hypothetical protein